MSKLLLGIVLVLWPSTVYSQMQILAPKTEAPIGVKPVTSGDYSAKRVSAAALASNSSSTNITVSQPSPPEGPWQISGTVNGMAFGPHDLFSFKAYDEHAGQFDPEVGIMFKEQFLNMKDDGPITLILVHEALHAALEAAFPDFANNCPKCAHQLINAVTAGAVCALATQCPPPNEPGADPPKPISDSKRKSLAGQANSESDKCKAHAAANDCGGCQAAPMPQIPPCPGICEVANCEG